MKKKKYYMHILNGRPAGFDRDQICYGWHRMPLASSLKQIREEQKWSRAYRMKNNLDILGKYRYLLIYLPDPREKK